MSALPRIFLVGFGPTTETALHSLAEQAQIVGLLRERSEDDSAILLADRLKVPVFDPRCSPDLQTVLEEAQPHCVVVSSYNLIIKPQLLNRWLFINVHYGPLPRYRGRASVNWAIINGESSAAISIHLIDEGLDSGNILFQEAIPIGARDTVRDLYQRLNEIQELHLGHVVARAVNEGWRGTPQDESSASYGCGRVPDDGEIEWAASAVNIDRLIRSLTPPFPGAFTFFRGRKLTVVRSEPLADPHTYVGRVPGRVLRRSKVEGWVDVFAGQGVLRIFEVEVTPGEVRQAAAVFGSTRATLGLRSSDILARMQHLSERLAQCEAALQHGEAARSPFTLKSG
jgi:methionyl-tRNA formyltransferase